MATNTNETTSQIQDVNSTKTGENLSETMTTNIEMDCINRLVEKLKNNKDLLDYTVNRLVDNVGSYSIESIIDKIKDKVNEDEPILNENTRKFTAFPIQYQNIWQKYKEQMACFWKPEEIDFSNDYNDFMTLNDNEKYFVEMILAFFAASGGIVNFNLSERFMKDVKNTEIIFAYQFQAMMENVHCVSGGTKILTELGYIKIVDELEKEIPVWNGKEFSKTVIKYTGDSQLYRVELSNGMYLDCTPEHKWFMRTGNPAHPERCKKSIIFTKDLKIDDVIHYYDLPVVDMDDINEFINPYIHGFWCGDGTYCNGYPRISLYGEKKKLLEQFNPNSYSVNEKEDKIQFYITKKINKEKFFVPINYSKETKLRWLEGVCDSDGCINYNKNETATSIQISNNERDFLKNIQLMLTTLGIHTNISLGNPAGQSSFPDHKGGTILCERQDNYVLYITISNVKRLYDIGFRPKRLKLVCSEDIVERAKLIKIKNITLLEGIHKTYCFNEPREHAGIFNGILTGQSETYSLMLDNIVKDPSRREFLFNAIKNVESVKMMADWAFKWIDSSKSFAHRVVAFAIVEAVFFSGAFAAIFWIKKFKNKNRDNSKGAPFMAGLITSNKFISRDEGLHSLFACEVYSLLKNKLSTSEINEIMRDGVAVAKKFMTDALPVKLISMSDVSMCDYIECIADRLLVLLGYKKIYHKKNPFKWMETISLPDKTNFFETRPHEYQDSHIMNKSNKSKIIINDEF